MIDEDIVRHLMRLIFFLHFDNLKSFKLILNGITYINFTN